MLSVSRAPWLALLLAIVVLSASPHAAAQRAQPTLSIDIDEPVVMLNVSETRAVTVMVRYRGSVPDDGAAQGVRIVLDASTAPAWVRVEAHPAEQRVTPGGGGGGDGEAAFTVSVTPNEPTGREPREFMLIARADPTLLHEAIEAEATMVVQMRHEQENMTHPTNPTPYAPAGERPAGSDGSSAAARRAQWEAVADAYDQGPPLKAQSARETGFTGGETFFLALFAAAGAYTGNRLRRRFA